MKIEETIPKKTLKKMPVSFQFLKPIDKSESTFINKYIGIKKYQSIQCNVNVPDKPISKII